MMAAFGIDQFAQHLVVTVVALGAAVIVARRVFGVFDRRSPATGTASSAAAASPGCSHCAAGAAAHKKQGRA